MHTDVPAEELAPGVQFLHCRANAVQGGDNLILDGAAAAEDFRRDYPEDFQLLAETELPFYWEHEGFDIRARQRVIELDRFGAVSGVTISQHLADVRSDEHTPELQSLMRISYAVYCLYNK